LALQFNGAEGDGAELEDDTILGATFTSCTGTKVQILTLRYSVRSLLALLVQKVQALTVRTHNRYSVLILLALLVQKYKY
jgi:hypothetical protein